MTLTNPIEGPSSPLQVQEPKTTKEVVLGLIFFIIYLVLRY